MSGDMQLFAGVSRHPRFFFEDGNFLILVNGRTENDSLLYNVHKSMIAIHTSWFDLRLRQPQDALPPGWQSFASPSGMPVYVYSACNKHKISFSRPLVWDKATGAFMLSGVTVAEFDPFLSIIYTTNFLSFDLQTPHEWESALRLASRWEAQSIQQVAVKKLGEFASDLNVERLALARDYGIREWVRPALENICLREHSLTEEELNRLTRSDAAFIMETRERITKGALQALHVGLDTKLPELVIADSSRANTEPEFGSFELVESSVSDASASEAETLLTTIPDRPVLQTSAVNIPNLESAPDTPVRDAFAADVAPPVAIFGYDQASALETSPAAEPTPELLVLSTPTASRSPSPTSKAISETCSNPAPIPITELNPTVNSAEVDAAAAHNDVTVSALKTAPPTLNISIASCLSVVTTATPTQLPSSSNNSPLTDTGSILKIDSVSAANNTNSLTPDEERQTEEQDKQGSRDLFEVESEPSALGSPPPASAPEVCEPALDSGAGRVEHAVSPLEGLDPLTSTLPSPLPSPSPSHNLPFDDVSCSAETPAATIDLATTVPSSGILAESDRNVEREDGWVGEGTAATWSGASKTTAAESTSLQKCVSADGGFWHGEGSAAVWSAESTPPKPPGDLRMGISNAGVAAASSPKTTSSPGILRSFVSLFAGNSSAVAAGDEPGSDSVKVTENVAYVGGQGVAQVVEPTSATEESERVEPPQTQEHCPDIDERAVKGKEKQILATEDSASVAVGEARPVSRQPESAARPGDESRALTEHIDKIKPPSSRKLKRLEKREKKATSSKTFRP